MKKIADIMKRKSVIIVMAEVIILAFAMIFSVVRFQREKITLAFEQDDFKCLAGKWDTGFYLDTNENEFAQIRIGLSDIELPNGSYLMDIQYRLAGSAGLAVNYVYGTQEYALIGEIELHEGNSEKNFEIILDEKDEGKVFLSGRLDSECADGDYLLFLEVTFASTFTWYKLRIFKLFLLMLVLDIAIYLWSGNMKGISSPEQRRVLTGVLLIAFVSGIPLMTDYLPIGHDLLFHLTRIEGMKEGLSGGFPVKIQPQWLNGHGYPASVFYGDLWLYIPTLLRAAGLPLQDCYKVFICLVNLSTAWISYYCFHKISGSYRTGLTAAALYTLSVYRLSNIYVRAAVGEFTAMIFFPVILFGLWFVFSQPLGKVRDSKVWIILSFGYLGVLFSHMISCEMVGLMTILVCVLQVKKVFEKERFLVLLKALSGLVAGGMWFWLPVLDYMRFGFTSTNTAAVHLETGNVAGMGLFGAQLFSTYYNVEGLSLASYMGIEDEMPISLGASFLLILVAAVYLSVCCWKEIKNKKEWGIALGLTLLSMWICMVDFPFIWLKENVGFTEFLISNLQFPWRFLAVATLLCVWIFVMIMSVVDVRKEMKNAFAVAVCVVLFLNSMDLMSGAVSRMETDKVYDGRALTSFNVAWEFLYDGADIEDYRNEITDVSGGVTVSEWEKGNNRMQLTVENASETEGTLELPLILYKGYSAKDMETGGKLHLSDGKSHRIVLHLPEGYAGKVEVKFSEPWYWRVSEIISLVSLGGMVMILVRGKRKHILTKIKA